MNRCLATLIALSFVFSSVPSPSFAGPNGEASLMVRYDDLDLSTSEGVNILRLRLKRGAEQACIEASGAAPGQQLDFGCMADALKVARAQLPQAIAEQHLSKSRAVAAVDPHR
jgi:UrcA family protein